MRKLCFSIVAVLVVTLFSSPSKADEVQYNLSGVFGPNTAADAPLSGPNGSFAMSFSLPQMPTPDQTPPGGGDFLIFSVPFNYSFQCDGCLTPVLFSGVLDDVVFGIPGLGSTLVVEFVTTDNNDYYWQFSGPQLFSGTLDHPSLISGGTLNLVNDGQFDLNSNPFEPVGNATLTAQTVATPEPRTLTLLIAALAFLAAFAFIKTQRA